MNKIKILVVEDEIIVAKDIASCLEDAGYHVTDIVGNSKAALESFRTTRPDVVLMDINIEGNENGIEVALAMKAIEDEPLTFVTALADDITFEKAKQAMPSAYIVKPFNERELVIAVNLAINNFTINQKENSDAADGSELPLILNEFIFVKNNSRFEKLNIEDILWVESSSNYSTINTADNRFTLICSLGLLHERLARPYLIRVHRSFLINTKKVVAFEENRVYIGKKEIPIGKTHKEEFFKMFRVI